MVTGESSAVSAGSSVKTTGPLLSSSTKTSSNYSLWTSKCSIIMLWHRRFLLSKNCQL